MWRDILIILAFVLATLTYLNLTPKRLSGYARSAKAEVGKRALYQRVFLLAGIIVSLLFVAVMIYGYARQTFEAATLLLGVSLVTAMWGSILSDVWKISQKWERIVDIVAFAVTLPSAVAAVILMSDLVLWQKFAYPLGGGCIAYGINALTRRRVDRRLKKKQSSNERMNERKL